MQLMHTSVSSIVTGLFGTVSVNDEQVDDVEEFLYLGALLRLSD